MLRSKFKEVVFLEQELAYSFHLGSDKNKSKLAKKVSKGNVSGTTSLSNNAIQNANDLSRVNKHNLRDYDENKELIRVDLCQVFRHIFLQIYIFFQASLE